MLDLSNNDMVVSLGHLEQITAMVQSGRAGGQWDGYGIISSAAGRDTSIGVILNNDGNGNKLYTTFSGVAVGLDEVLLKFTYHGDADLNGLVDGADYFLADQGYLSNGALGGWRFGDFNYDGEMNIADYLMMDRASARQGAVLSAGVVAAVPEPLAASWLVPGLLCLRRRR